MLENMQLWQIQQKVHVSWMIASTGVGIVVGCALVAHLDQSMFANLAWLLLGLAIVILASWRSKRYCVPIAVMGGLCIGLWRGSVLENQLTIYKSLIGQSVTLRGVVSDDPDLSKRGEVVLRLKEIHFNGKMLEGKIWTSFKTESSVKRSDVVTIVGKLQDGFGNFSAAMYQPKLLKVQRPQPGDVAGSIRDTFAEKVRLGIKDPESSLGLGYLLGQRRALPPELTQALVVTGLTHVVVASGYNLTVLVRLTRRLFVRISKYLATLSASIMIVGFMAVTGASPSMSRAGLVTGLSLAAWYYGRRIHPLVILPLAAAITVLVEPSYAWNDLGWQLSFAAFGGVMILAPLLQRYFFGEKKPSFLRQIIGETISAFICTLPILIVSFGQFSNVAIITNMLILPLVPIAMLLTFVAGIGGLLGTQIATGLGAPAQLLLNYMIAIINYFANIPWAQTTVQVGPWFTAISYTILIGLAVYLWRATRLDLKNSNIVE